MTGTPIRFRNRDKKLHNFHATPVVNKEFNFALPELGASASKVFTDDEVMVRLKCDVHPWMFAYIGVVPHPYFAVTDENGVFTIDDVPNGGYVLEAVHLKAGRSSQGIAVTNGTTRVNFTLKPAA
jgi:hypothetical protein